MPSCTNYPAPLSQAQESASFDSKKIHHLRIISWESKGPTPEMPRLPQEKAGLKKGLFTTIIP